MRILGRVGMVSVLALAALIMVACPSTPYGKAAKLGLDVTDAIHTGADTLDKLRLNGTVTKDQEKEALQYLNALNKFDTDVYGPCVQKAHLDGGDATVALTDCARGFLNNVNDPLLLASFHITNADTLKTIQSTASAIVNLLNVGITGIQSAKGKSTTVSSYRGFDPQHCVAHCSKGGTCGDLGYSCYVQIVDSEGVI